MPLQCLVRGTRVVVATLTLAVSLASGVAMAATHTVPVDGDLQGALNAAQPGDTILLASGATYLGNFKLPFKEGAAFVTIRTGAAAAQLPRAGQRTSPAYAAILAKLQSPNTMPALSAAAGAHHYRIENVEFLPTAGGVGDIIALGGSASQTDPAQMPWGIVFDRVYIHGDPVVGQKRGIALNSGYTEVLNSYIADIKSVGADSQALCGWNGSGPFLIENNYLEAAGENVMFGGADPSIWSLVPSDITLRRNLLTKPVQWRAEKWLVKNALELKNARRVLIEGNVLENVWRAGQTGFAVQFTPRNQNGRAPWSTVEDVTFRYNVIRHAGSAINISGWDDLQASGQAQRIQIANNVVYDIDGDVWGGSGIFLQLGNSPASIVVERNTVVQAGTALNVYGSKRGAPWVIDGFAFRDNLVHHNTYGVKGDSLGVGTATLAGYFSGLVFERNVLAGGAASKYPAGNYFPTVDEYLASFVNAGAGDFTLAVTSPFRRSASDGGALGADLASLRVASGTAPAPTRR